MTKQTLPSSQQQKETTISKQTRNAFVSAVLFTVGALLNFAVSLQASLKTFSITSIADTITLFLFAIITIFSATLIRKGQKEKGVWILLGSLALALGVRNALTTDLSVIFSILSISLIPLMGLLTLNPKLFNRTLSLAIFVSSFYLAFDILASRYLPPYRQQSGDVEFMVRMISVMAVLLTIGFIVALIKQHHFLLLSSKITLGMVFAVLIPIIALSIAGTSSLKSTLVPQQNEIMHTKATLVAQSIDNLITTNKHTLQVNAQSPIIIEYLSYLSEDSQSANGEKLAKQALQNLEAFKQKNALLIRSYAILNISGENILDTSPENIGNNENEANYFTHPLKENAPFVSDLRKTGADEYSLYFSAPIRLKNGEIIGVIRAQYHSDILQEQLINYMKIEQSEQKDVFVALLSEKEVKQISPEDPSSVYLVFANGLDPELNFMSVTPLTTNVITPLQMNRVLPIGSTSQLSLDVPGLDDGIRNRSSSAIFNAQAFPRETELTLALDVITAVDVKEEQLSWIIIISQDLLSFNAPFQQQVEINTLLAILIAIGATFLAYTGSQYFTKPILNFVQIAEKVEEGDLTARIEINSEDEMGVLGTAFNSMTSQLNTFISTLESRVAERTKALERSEQQLRAAITVGSAAASLRDIDELLTQATEQISAQFGFYHAGIFLIDPYGKYALLKAANSEGGRRMLVQEHKLGVGEEGIVGYVTKTGEARIALDVGRDAAFFNNPDLPQTRSEMALPLIAGGKILGALDIQSAEGEAFNETDATTLQVLADQIAIAIENAHLFEESRQALAAAQRAYGEQSHIGWQELIHKAGRYGYRSGSDGSIYPLEEKADANLEKAIQENQVIMGKESITTNIPIMVRGKPVGAIQLSKPANARSWDQKDLELAKTLTTEISRAMDSARLFDETKQQADRERVAGEISNRMRETMSVESVVRLAADELYKLLELEDITIHLESEDNEEKEEIA